jgi:phage tail tape-measure protein
MVGAAVGSVVGNFLGDWVGSEFGGKFVDVLTVECVDDGAGGANSSVTVQHQHSTRGDDELYWSVYDHP